jgi:hypothetical protein
VVKRLAFYRTLSIFLVFFIISALVGVKFIANSTSVTATSRLYPVKLVAEGIILRLADPDDRAKIEAYQLKQRVVELRSLELRLSAPDVVDPARLKQATASTRAAAEIAITSIQENLQFIKNPAEKSVIEDEVKLSRVELSQ